MGVSPWTAAPITQSSEGTTGAMNHVAPLGLRTRAVTPEPWAHAQWLPHAVPLGLKQNPSWRKHISPWHHRIAPRHHRISLRCHRFSPQRGVIAFSRNAATGCSHGRKPMDRGPPLAQSPEGSTGAMIHVAPFGILVWCGIPMDLDGKCIIEFFQPVSRGVIDVDFHKSFVSCCLQYQVS
jgi:hypothetical protein